MSPVEARPGIPREIAGAPLTPREIEVLELIANGLSDAEISARLWISTNTTKTHVKHLRAKLRATSKAHAAAEGIRLGLIE